MSDIYRPRRSGKTPTILVRIPFSSTFKNRLAADVVGTFWASRGYTVVIQGTRGRYKSGGEFYPLLHERQDGQETLTWLAVQPWFDGRLGMWGGSAFGHTQWVIADQEAPGPTALIIQIASTSFREMFHPGNAFSLESALFWAARSRGKEDQDPSLDALERGYAGFPLIEADDRAVGDVPFFNDWVRHAEADDILATHRRPGSRQDDQGAGAADGGLVRPVSADPAAGLRDPAARSRAASRGGQPSHHRPLDSCRPVRFPDGSTAGDYRPASLAPSLPWFDHHLLGRAPDRSLAAPVRIYVMGENRVAGGTGVAAGAGALTPFYLRSGGRRELGRRRRAPRRDAAFARRSAGFVHLRSAPTGAFPRRPDAGLARGNRRARRRRGAPGRAGVLDGCARRGSRGDRAGERDALRDDHRAHTDFSVKLVDVHPDGRAYNVSDGLLRRAYPDSARAAPTEITVQLWPTSMLFRRGHRVRVEVSSSNYPRYDRNPNTGRDIATETEPRSALQTVFHSASAPSRIVLPVIPR